METVLELKEKYADAIKRIVLVENGEPYKSVLPTGLVYLSHPFGGRRDNVVDAGQMAKWYQKKLGTKGTIVSPIHNFSWLSYKEEEEGYWEDIYHCLALLSRCDAMILTGDWKKSMGCCIEYLYCVDHDIPLVIAKEKDHD